LATEANKPFHESGIRQDRTLFLNYNPIKFIHQIMYRLIEKLRLDRYISSRLILALDLLVSVGASIISLLVASILLG